MELVYTQPQDILARILNPSIVEVIDDSAQDFLENAQNRVKDAQEMIKLAMTTQKRYYDSRHSPLTKWKVGDFGSLRLDLHPIKAIQTNKIGPQKLPPYKVLEVKSNGRAIRLDFPNELKIHPVVSVQHVDKVSEDPFQRPENQPPPLAKFPESIFDKKKTRGRNVQYKVKFQGYDVSRAEWMNAVDVPQEMVLEFKKKLKERRMRVNEIEAYNAIEENSEEEKHPLDRTFPTRRPKPGTFVERPVLYISRTTHPFERNYESTKRELACVNWCFQRCRHLLEGSKTTVVTDHAAIREVLQSSADTVYSIRIDKARWQLAPYLDDLEVVYRPSREHLNVDHLLRPE